MSSITTSDRLGKAFQRLESNWGWFVALGFGLLLAGFIAGANLFATTLVSILYIAAMMFVGGVMQIIQAFLTHGWRHRALYLAIGLLYAAAGAIAVYDPILSAIGVSLGLGFLLVVSGGLKMVSGFREHGRKGWGWIAASGLLTLAIGAVIVAAWPSVGLWLLGAMLSFDLVFQGWGFVVFGLALRARGAHASLGNHASA